MKKVFLIVALAVSSLVANSFNVASSPQLSVKKTSVYLGTVSTGGEIIELYGDSSTGIVDSVIFLATGWPGGQVSFLQNVKIVSGVATGKIYLDVDGSQAIIILTNLPVS